MRPNLRLLLFAAVLTLARPAGAAIITFEDLAQPPGSNTIGGDRISTGFLFDINTNHSHLVNDAFSSFNGTTWLGLDDTDGDHTLLMSRVGGGTFSLQAADFSEFFTDDNGHARLIDVTGNFAGGGTIFLVIALDLVADGPGPLNDFQTQLFGPAWTNLVSVQFIAHGGANDWWAIDNIVTQVPEPGLLMLVGAGLGLAAVRRRREYGPAE